MSPVDSGSVVVATTTRTAAVISVSSALPVAVADPSPHVAAKNAAILVCVGAASRLCAESTCRERKRRDRSRIHTSKSEREKMIL